MGRLSVLSLAVMLVRDSIEDLVWATASLRSRVALACWVELASKNGRRSDCW